MGSSDVLDLIAALSAFAFKRWFHEATSRHLPESDKAFGTESTCRVGSCCRIVVVCFGIGGCHAWSPKCTL